MVPPGSRERLGIDLLTAASHAIVAGLAVAAYLSGSVMSSFTQVVCLGGAHISSNPLLCRTSAAFHTARRGHQATEPLHVAVNLLCPCRPTILCDA